MSLGIVGGFEQRTEQIVDQFLKVVDQLVGAVDVAVLKSPNQRLKFHKMFKSLTRDVAFGSTSRRLSIVF